EAQLDGHAVEHTARANDAPERLDVVWIEELELGQAMQRVAKNPSLLRNQLQLEGRLVVHQHAAAAVQDQPAAGRNRILAHAVALRELQVIIVTNDLQHNQLAQQAQAQQADDQYGREGATGEDALFVPLILDAHAI